MKRIFIMVVGFLLSSSAFACNWDRQICSELILKDVPQQLNALNQIPEFVQKYGNEVQFKARYTDQMARSCNSYRACNQYYSNFAGWVYIHYVHYIKKPQQGNMQVANSNQVRDKWTDQCVIWKANVIKTYADDAATKQIGTLQDTAFFVTKTNGSNYVGLTNAENKKFVGWVKKTDLQMQELCNCNMF